ncbi:MAG TPA: hypothetical protein VKU02_17840 [Gemmataceae bacterium]|nr:hypothetical protein [Gemmataceae bacterium]
MAGHDRIVLGASAGGVKVLARQQSLSLEAALWTAARIFKEKTILSRPLAAQQQQRGNAESAARFMDEARRWEHYAALIRDCLLRRQNKSDSPSEGQEPSRSTQSEENSRGPAG